MPPHIAESLTAPAFASEPTPLPTPAPAARRGRSIARLAGTTALAVALLAACGGGGGGGDTPELPSALSLAQQCSPNNPFRGDAEAEITVADLATEKRWVRSYMNEAYLWYREVPAVDASLPAYSDEADVYGSLDRYFEALKTTARTASGKRKDEFSFTFPTKQWNELSQSGAVVGYGIEWHIQSLQINAQNPTRGIRIAYVEPNSPAANAGLRRGDLLVTVDGVSADTTNPAEIPTLNAGVFPSAAGNHSFVFSRNGSNLPALTLAAGTVVKQPVLTTQVLDIGGQKVGYIVFNDHFGAAETQLAAAIQTLKDAAVTDLVLDLRYNGGGFLYIASQLAYMIAGPARTAGKTFERLQYNDKRTADTNASATPFIDRACVPDANFDCTSNATLPTLGLARLYVIAGGPTCSASEAIVNGLRGVDVDVRLIGATTCGKPYGFTAQDNCGISYFPIEFQGVNHKGFGDYADGFTPQCAAADDFSRELGDVAEGRLAAALYLRAHGTCPPAAARESAQALRAAEGGFMRRGPARENRIVRQVRW